MRQWEIPKQQIEVLFPPKMVPLRRWEIPRHMF